MRFKVIVIDDKPLIRQSIVQTIDWSGMDCEMAGEAENGIEGKRLITEIKPDIIITDIKMPGLNGLDISEFVKSWNPRAKIILITGYQEFELAQRALRLGVHELLLKPLSNEDIYRAVGCAVDRLRHEQVQYNDAMDDFRKKWVVDAIHRRSAESEKYGLTCANYLLAIARMKNKPAREASAYFNLIREAVKMLEHSYGIMAVNVPVNNDIVLLVLFKEAIDERSARLIVKSFYGRLSAGLAEGQKADFAVAAGSLYDDLQLAHEAYDEALRMLDCHFFNTKEKLLFPSADSDPKLPEGSFIVEDLQQFYSVLENGNEEELMLKLHTLLQKIDAFSHGNIFVAKGLFAEVCITVARQCYKKWGNGARPHKDIDELLLDIDQFQTSKEAAAYIHDYIAGVRSAMDHKAESTNPLVTKVMDNIKHSYADNLSLESLGDRFGLNPSYLSRLLKRETGKNFVDIVSGVRIEAAKRLLKAPNSKVYEVAERVGYKDYTYFYQVFKKLEGMSPNEYKRSAAL